MIKKVKLWIEKAGFVSLLYFGLFIGTLIFGDLVLGLIGLKFLREFLSGAFLGIFIYINWNVLAKIWKEDVKPEIQILAEKVENKIKKN